MAYAYLSTTTTGDSDSVTNMSPFQIMRAEKTIIARFSPWKARFRLFFHSFFNSTFWLMRKSHNTI